MLRSSIQLRWEVLKVSHKTSWSNCWRDDRSSLWFYTPPFQILREIADILMGLVLIRLSLNLQDHTKDGGCTTHHNRLHELFCGWRWGSDLAWGGVIKNEVGGKWQKGCWVALQIGKTIKSRSFSGFVSGCYDKLTRSVQRIKHWWVFSVFLLTSNCEAFVPKTTKGCFTNVVPKGVDNATQKPFSPSDRGMFYSTTLGWQEMEEYYEEETYEEIVGGGGGGGR